MSPLECLTALNQAGGAAWVESGQLQIELPDDATSSADALLDELKQQKAELVELLTREPMPSPADHPLAEREVLTHQVDAKSNPLVDAYAPDREIENFVLDLWQIGAVVFANPDSGSLVVDAPRGALDDTQRAFLAARAGGVFEAVHWLGVMDRRATYKRAFIPGGIALGSDFQAG
ncbi:MAG: hypothetical protein HY774_26915 [Acidobacteria bacterium]|nr:hypothetical protein [Acidobacteriota bacterium]